MGLAGICRGRACVGGLVLPFHMCQKYIKEVAGGLALGDRTDLGKYETEYVFLIYTLQAARSPSKHVYSYIHAIAFVLGVLFSNLSKNVHCTTVFIVVTQ